MTDSDRTPKFPPVIIHDGKRYTATGKFGTHTQTGQPAWEYATVDDERIWRLADGTIVED